MKKVEIFCFFIHSYNEAFEQPEPAFWHAGLSNKRSASTVVTKDGTDLAQALPV